MQNHKTQAVIRSLETAKKHYNICKYLFFFPLIAEIFNCDCGFCWYFSGESFYYQILNELEFDRDHSKHHNKSYWYTVKPFRISKFTLRLDNINRTLKRLKQNENQTN